MTLTDLQALERDYLMGTYARHPVEFVRGEGSRLWDAEGNSYNVNADDAARAVAKALKAYKLVFLTDTPGWLADVNDPDSKITEATPAQVRAKLDEVSGGMRPKLAACVDAIHGGVSFAHIVDGRVPHSLLLELFTDAGQGTKIGPAT